MPMFNRIKKARQEYEGYKMSSSDEGFIEWYLKRFAKDITKFALSLILLACSTWLIYDLSRIIVMFKVVIILYIAFLVLDVLTRKK